MADFPAAAGETAPTGLEVVVVSGLSGAGRSTAAKCLRTSATTWWTTCRRS